MNPVYPIPAYTVEELNRIADGLLCTDAEPRGYDPYNSATTVQPATRDYRRDSHAVIRILLTNKRQAE